jgi:hypothetical protein
MEEHKYFINSIKQARDYLNEIIDIHENEDITENEKLIKLLAVAHKLIELKNRQERETSDSIQGLINLLNDKTIDKNERVATEEDIRSCIQRIRRSD